MSITYRDYTFKPFDFKQIRHDCTIGLFGSGACFQTEIEKQVHCPIVLRTIEDLEAMEHTLGRQRSEANQLSASFNRWKESFVEIGRREEEAEKEQALRTSAEHQEDIRERLLQRWKKNRRRRRAFYKEQAYEQRRSIAKFIWVENETLLNAWVIRSIVNNGRFFSIGAALVVPSIRDFPSYLRGGLDWVMVFQEEDLELMWNMYGRMFPSKMLFEKVLVKMREEKACMVMDMRSKSIVLTDKVYYCKVE